MDDWWRRLDPRRNNSWLRRCGRLRRARRFQFLFQPKKLHFKNPHAMGKFLHPLLRLAGPAHQPHRQNDLNSENQNHYDYPVHKWPFN